MMKFAVRHNMIYPLQLLIFNFARDTESTLISKLLKFEGDLIFTPVMFLGEFFAGLIIFSYQKYFLFKKTGTNKKEEKSSFKVIKLLQRKNNDIDPLDPLIKIYFLIFTSSFFDFVQFVLSLYTPKFMNISGSLESRLGGFLTIFDALFYYYILRFPIFRHQFLSLIVIGICLLIVIICEFIFQGFNIFLTVGDFILVLVLSFLRQFSSSMVDSIEKYLFEFNHINPLKILMFEGLFGFIYTFIYCLVNDPLEDIRNYQNKNDSSNFILLIFSLILYLILSGLKNSFRVMTTKIYTPMTTTFLDYILNPFYMIYYFLMDEDFIKDGKKNIPHFVINLILTLIISFFGCVYNEFIILFFCELEIDTHQQVSQRASITKERELDIKEDDDEDEIEES